LLTKALTVFCALVIGASLSTTQTSQAATAWRPPALQPIDPQRVQDQQDMTWQDYKPIPGVSWATSGAIPTDRALRVALVAVDFPDQPFVMTKPKHSDPFGNPQIDPIARDDIPEFYADFFNKPSAANHYQTINGYWLEQSGGKIGITSVTPYGPYRMPKNSSQYGLTDIGQERQQGCPGQTTVTGGQADVTTIAVESTKFLKVGDSITIAGVTPSGQKIVTGIPDETHLTLSSTVTVTDKAAINNCAGSRLEPDADKLWHADANCTGNCGYDVVLRIYAGYDETSVWQEFGEMKFQSEQDVPREIWGNPNPALPNSVPSRYVPWTSWLAGSQLWGQATIRQAESSGTITHELSHFFFSIGDNNNNPYVQPYHRAGSGPWDMMDRGSFNGPGGPHNRWQVPAQQGASMGAELTLRSKIGMGFVPYSSVLRLNRDGLAGSGLAVADVIARAVNAGPLPKGTRAGIQVSLDGTAPVDRSAACDVNTNPLCDGGGPSGGWSNYSLETVQRIGYGSFQPDNGVLIAKNKAYEPGSDGKEGSTCGYNCFTWVVDAHPEDIDTVDYKRPDGSSVKRSIGDYRQLNDALFHAGTNSGSKNEYVDASNGLRFYILDQYQDAKGLLHYVIGVQNPKGAGPQKRGVAVAKGRPGGKAPENATYCSFRVTNTGRDAATDPALHPQDERAHLRNDIYRLSASAEGNGWSAQLPSNLTTAAFGASADVPVYVTRAPGGAHSGTVELTATSVSDPAKKATSTCKVKSKDTDR
jgi:M6 family metalloprotease-like protein